MSLHHPVHDRHQYEEMMIMIAEKILDLRCTPLDSFMMTRPIGLNHTCDMTHSYVYHDPFIHVT